ncbi:uncharacterized protein LOC133663008 [Entelurus aequoreus]|uniref:uncharacterized protein LOC133663007 n=1 Tax=Entelurus aequoreus TaxID=161455 RepID=UPI002B1D5B8B|nr:uncharacterized protein LOC133663007 [Entelurus aequoreus]XP_061923179.1 uncharacterized protein LOC133663008 [Entelurus aequoreus]
MPRAKGHRRALACRTMMAERRSLTPIPVVPEFVARRGTGFRHRVRRWPTSHLTGRQVKFVPPAIDPEKKTVFFIGDSHLRGLVDGDVALPKVPLSFSFLSVPGGGAADLRTEVGRLEFPWTPDVVCVLAPSNDLDRGPSSAAAEFGALLTSVRSRWPKVFVLDFPPRLNKPVGLQDQLRQEHRRVAARMGVPFVAVTDSFLLDRLELWCHDGVHLSDTGGSPILVKLLCDAALTLFPTDPPAPPSPLTDCLDPQTWPRLGDEGEMDCIPASAGFWRKMAERQSRIPMPPVPEFVARGPPILVEPAPSSPRRRSPPAQVTGPDPLPRRRQDPRRWTTVGRERKAGTLPVQQSLPIPSNPVWFSSPMLDAMEEFAPSSDSNCTAVPPPGQASPGRRRRRAVAVRRAGQREFTSDSDCTAVPPPGQASPGRCRRRPVAVRCAERREQVGVNVFPLQFQVPAVRGEPTVIREEPAVQEEAQVPLQVFADKSSLLMKRVPKHRLNPQDGLACWNNRHF